MDPTLDYKAYPILFVDDEPDIIETFRLNYEDAFTVLTATSGRAALQILADQPVAILVADQRMPEMSGVDVIREALVRRPHLIPIILTGYTDVEALVDAINLGRVHRYMAKPWDSRELRMALARAVEVYHLGRENARLADENARLVEKLRHANERLEDENRYLKQVEAPAGGFDAILGQSQAIQDVLARTRRVLDSPTTVLLEGPTGTGKELVARAIHYAGARREKLFVAVNCGELSETLLGSELFGHRRGAFTGAVGDKKGLFEIADGGTLFLDEVGETSPAVQIHLLRVLQEGEVRPVGAARPIKVDVRVITATNRDLATEVQRGKFREDLYFRLSVFRIRIPPLNDRLEDIPLLAEHFLRKHSVAMKRPIAGIAPEALTALMCHDYRGNVRELGNILERAVLLAEPGAQLTEVELFDREGTVPTESAADRASLADDVVRFERERIKTALERFDGNKSQAARHLGLTYRGLLKKMQRFGLAPAAGKQADEG